MDGLSKLLDTLKNLNEDQLAVLLSLQDLQEKNCNKNSLHLLNISDVLLVYVCIKWK
jgi:hypothetical protein